MKISDLNHFSNKLELPYLAHLTRLQNNECSSEADVIQSKIKLAEYVLLTEEIKKHIQTRQQIIEVCNSVFDYTFNERFNSGATSIDDCEDYTPIGEYLCFFLEDLRYFSAELAQFAQFVPQMDEILSEGLNKFFPGLKFGQVKEGKWHSMDDEDVARHRKETLVDNKQKSFKVLSHNEAIDKARDIIQNGGDLNRLVHILQHGSDLTLMQNYN